MFSLQFNALSREAGIAAAAIGQGINGINNATYAGKGYYHYAFFNLSIALERLGKLIFILDKLLTTDTYPTDQQLRALGHKLTALIESSKEIRVRNRLNTNLFPTDAISTGIVETLSDFATATRYYNLDFLVGGKSIVMNEPIAAWYERVGKPILAAHYRDRQRINDEAKTRALSALLEPTISVLHTAEDGRAITSWTEGALETSKIKTLQRYTRMYCLRIVRFLCEILVELQYASMKVGHEIPFFSEFFGIFRNDDAYFLRRKKWDPYRP